MPNKITIDELRDLINKGEATDPLIFLESVMNGQDPRGLSEIYKLVCEIDEWGSLPTRHEWEDLVGMIRAQCKYSLVSLSESTAAAKTVAEYLHSKKKSIETIEGNSEGSIGKPLNEKEIRAFLKIYESEF